MTHSMHVNSRVSPNNAKQSDMMGDTFAQNVADKGRKWECADERGECVEKVDGVL